MYYGTPIALLLPVPEHPRTCRLYHGGIGIASLLYIGANMETLPICQTFMDKAEYCARLRWSLWQHGIDADQFIPSVLAAAQTWAMKARVLA